MLDRMSEDELWTGVEVRQASCDCPDCPLPLFRVLGKGLEVGWPTMAKSLHGTAFDSFVVRVEMVSELTFCACFFFGVLFRRPPFIFGSVVSLEMVSGKVG